MRKILALLSLCLLTLTGCNGSNGNSNNSNENALPPVLTEAPKPIKPEAPVDPAFKSCNPFMPLLPGSQLVYTINYSSGLSADARVVIDLKEENGQKIYVERTQIVDKSGGLQKNELEEKRYVCDGERVRLISYRTENKVEGKLTRSEWKMRTEAIAMIEPSSLARKGSKWSYSFLQSFQAGDQPPINLEEPTFIFFESAGEEEVSVPAGKFKAVKVVRKVNQNELTEYFARGMGLVKRESKEGTGWILKEYAGVKPAGQ
jgi:hypothetical protein